MFIESLQVCKYWIFIFLGSHNFRQKQRHLFIEEKGIGIEVKKTGIFFQNLIYSTSTPSEFFPLNWIYLTASKGYGENQERYYLEKCFIICEVLGKY